MATQPEPQDLDNILDDALDAFDPSPDDVEEAPPLPFPLPSSASAASAAAAPGHARPSQPPHAAAAARAPTLEESAAPPGGDDHDDPGRALEDALRALSQLHAAPTGENGLHSHTDLSGNVDADRAEADMKLVEDFVTSLGESLSTLGAADVLDAAQGTRATADNADAQSTSRTQSQANGTAQQQQHEQKQSQPVVERLVESIVSQLLSEDVLKGPMMQMREAYAEWLPSHEQSLSDVDRKRFRRQRDLVNDICKRYEGGASSTTDIMTLLSQMQELGSPPDEVMSKLSTDGHMDAFIERFAGGLDVGK